MDPNSGYTAERTFGGTAAGFAGSFTPPHGYALSGKIMLSAIIVLFSIVVAIFILHVYIRWHLHRLSLQQRRRRPGRPLIFASEIRGTAAAPRGLDPKTLDSLPVVVCDGDKSLEGVECAVCLCEFEKGETVRCLPRCGHRFHIECINMWFHSHSTCPLCRSGVELAVKAPVTDVAPAVSGCGTGAEIGSSSTAESVSRVTEFPPMGGDESKSPAGPMGAIRRLLSRDLSLYGGATEEEVVDLERGEPPERTQVEPSLYNKHFNKEQELNLPPSRLKGTDIDKLLSHINLGRLKKRFQMVKS